MKTRALLTIIIAVLTGFVAGYLTSNQVRHMKIRDVKTMSSVNTFKERTFELVQPDSRQEEEITPLVELYAARFDSLKKQTFKQYKDFLDEFHSELYPYLSQEQIDRMEDFARHLRKGPEKKHPGKNDGD